MDKSATCKTCVYFVESLTEASVSGQCRVNPPQVVAGSGANPLTFTVWPVVAVGEWCGKWVKKL